MLKLKPKFTSDWSYRDLLFRSVVISARWNDRDGVYALKDVELTDHPRNPSGHGPDLRRKAHSLKLDFFDFASTIRNAVNQVGRLAELQALYGSELCEIAVPLDANLTLTSGGIFLSNWPLAPIIRKPTDDKLATLAVLQMLEIEANLPDDRM